MGCGGGRQQEQAQVQRARRTGRERGQRLLSGCHITPTALPVNTVGLRKQSLPALTSFFTFSCFSKSMTSAQAEATQGHQLTQLHSLPVPCGSTAASSSCT